MHFSKIQCSFFSLRSYLCLKSLFPKHASSIVIGSHITAKTERNFYNFTFFDNYTRSENLHRATKGYSTPKSACALADFH